MMKPTQQNSVPRDPQHRRFPSRHPLLVVLLFLGVPVVAFHASLLRSVYGILVVDQATENCRCVMIATPTPGCFDAAAGMLASAAVEQALLVDMRPRRSVRVGAIPSNETLWKRDLVDRGVSADRIRAINTEAATPHQMFRELDAILRHEGNTRCIVISTSTLSRYYRQLIDDALSPARASRFRVHAVLPEKSDASTWWRTRSGINRVIGHGLRLSFVLFVGESDIDPEDPYWHLTAKQAS